jgi:opacity protein-like surface antigen
MKAYLERLGSLALLGGAVVIVMSIIVISSPAKAQQPTFYIGGHAGTSMANTALGLDGMSLDGLGGESQTPSFGVRAGVDFAVPNSIVFVGAFGTYTMQNVEFSISDGDETFKAALKNSWSVGGRAGVVLGNAKPYILAAYRQTEVEWTNLGPGFPSGPTLKGYDLGAGMSYAINKDIDIGVEGIWTKYKNVTLEDVFCDPLSLDTTQLAVMGYVNFKFGAAEEAKPVNGAKRLTP